MNLFYRALVRKLPLVGAAGLMCLLAVRAGGWGSTVPAPTPGPEAQNSWRLSSILGCPIDADERAAIAERQGEFQANHEEAVIAVFPVRIGSALDTECATNLARSLPRAGIGGTCGIVRPVAFVASRLQPTEKDLWDLAREFRDHVRKNPTGADYALYAEYVPTTDRAGYRAVHLVLCDAHGEWVIVDRQDFFNSGLDGLQPVTKSDADAVVVHRLKDFLSGPSANPSHPHRIAPTRAPDGRVSSTPFPP